jgi:light-independent protochlorophyllide reductase subunit B
MGLEEHLLGMFREDFEFGDHAAPSHLGHGHAPAKPAAEPVAELAPAVAEAAPVAAPPPITEVGAPTWAVDAEKELKKIPFFVRGKARRNTERFAADQGVALITVETLYDAKAHFGR